MIRYDGRIGRLVIDRRDEKDERDELDKRLIEVNVMGLMHFFFVSVSLLARKSHQISTIDVFSGRESFILRTLLIVFFQNYQFQKCPSEKTK